MRRSGGRLWSPPVTKEAIVRQAMRASLLLLLAAPFAWAGDGAAGPEPKPTPTPTAETTQEAAPKTEA